MYLHRVTFGRPAPQKFGTVKVTIAESSCSGSGATKDHELADKRQVRGFPNELLTVRDQLRADISINISPSKIKITVQSRITHNTHDILKVRTGLLTHFH